MIEVRHLRKVFAGSGDEVLAVDDVSFEVSEGSFFVLLGASGSGKTTTLRMLAGLEQPNGGEILMGGEPVYSSSERVRTSAARRPIAMMFQTYALWPHMTVERNVTFPLRHGRLRFGRAEARQRCEQALDLLHITALRRRPVSDLSGGQQQRVALARALAQQPKVLLMDEPLSNLDAKLRAELRVSLKELTSRLGITTVYVTHDQTEAMVMGDAIGVMHGGELLQVGAPEEVYRRPSHVYVARFMGEMNFLRGQVAAVSPDGSVQVDTGVGVLPARFATSVRRGDPVEIGVRHEDIDLDPPSSEGSTSLVGRVQRRSFVGEAQQYAVALADGTTMQVRTAARQVREPGDEVRVGFETGFLGFAIDGSETKPASRPAAPARRDPDAEPQTIIDPGTYEAGYPHAEFARLRRTAGLPWVEAPGFEPFWAVTRHADLLEVARDPEQFGSAGRWLILPRAIDLDGSATGSMPLRMLVNMDSPEHRAYRSVASGWFTPRTVKRLEHRIHSAATELISGAVIADRPIDVVEDLAARLPLFVITELLGIPEADADLVLRLSNENFGAADPEFQRAEGDRDGFLEELGTYLIGLGRDRRSAPGSDLASIIASATIDGSPMPEFELMSYLYLLATAGHETTRNAISGGILALAERPDQFERLRSDPALASTATEEILRWTSPIIHFARTARRDCSLAGQSIAAGDSVALFYPSANRDEAVFDRPEDFLIDRAPNPQIAFGFGEHYCLGAALARLEVKAILDALATNVRSVEQVGDVERLRSSFVGGLKRFPAVLRPAR